MSISILFITALMLSSPVTISSMMENGNYTLWVEPNGNEIAGMQADFLYDGRYVKVNEIVEGDLISQHDNFSTFFNEGTIIPPARIVNTFDAVIGMHSTSIPGTFVILNVTGNGCIVPENVKISDSNGNPIFYEVIPYCELQVGSISGSVNNE